MRRRRALAAACAAGVVGAAAVTGSAALLGATSAPTAAAAPAPDVATVRLAGDVSPAAPDADTVATITIPLTITNTGKGPLYDLSVASLRSAPITDRAGLTTAFDGDPVEEGDYTKNGPRQPVPGASLAPGASERFDYVVDSSSDGICLCVLGVYAVDLLVSGAEDEGGETSVVARTQTYLPSLLGVQDQVRVGWLWPLLDRPHRFGAGTEFADDDLATSVAPGGRLDRALAVLQGLDSADAGQPGLARSVMVLLDPDLVDELTTMAAGYTVRTADGRTTPGTGGRAAAAWLARLQAVVPRHDVRLTPPADPDVVGLADQGVPVQAAPDDATAARVTAALGLPAGRLPAHDLAWPVESDLDAGSVRSLAAAGATRVVTTADTDDDGAVAALAAGTGDASTTPALLADPVLVDEARGAVGLGRDTGGSLQRLVVSAAMTSVQHDDDSRFVFVVPDRDVDVNPAAAVRAVEATAALGRPVSPLAALADAATATTRSDLLTARQTPPPAPLDAALSAAAEVTTAAAHIRAAAVSGADTVVGDVPALVQRATSNSWVGDDDTAARWTTTVEARTTALRGAVRVVVPATGGYSLASADAPLLLTVSNDLPVDMRIRVDVSAGDRSNGFEADTTDTRVAAGTRPTIQVPTSVTRSGRFDVTVTLTTVDGDPIGAPARIAVTSTAVGAVGQIVTYGAGALLVLALLVRGVRRLVTRSRAGSGGTGPGDDPTLPDGRPEGPSTVSATTS